MGNVNSSNSPTVYGSSDSEYTPATGNVQSSRSPVRPASIRYRNEGPRQLDPIWRQARDELDAANQYGSMMDPIWDERPVPPPRQGTWANTRDHYDRFHSSRELQSAWRLHSDFDNPDLEMSPEPTQRNTTNCFLNTPDCNCAVMLLDSFGNSPQDGRASYDPIEADLAMNPTTSRPPGYVCFGRQASRHIHVRSASLREFVTPLLHPQGIERPYFVPEREAPVESPVAQPGLGQFEAYDDPLLRELQELGGGGGGGFDGGFDPWGTLMDPFNEEDPIEDDEPDWKAAQELGALNQYGSNRNLNSGDSASPARVPTSPYFNYNPENEPGSSGQLSPHDLHAQISPARISTDPYFNDPENPDQVPDDAETDLTSLMVETEPRRQIEYEATYAEEAYDDPLLKELQELATDAGGAGFDPWGTNMEPFNEEDPIEDDPNWTEARRLGGTNQYGSMTNDPNFIDQISYVHDRHPQEPNFPQVGQGSEIVPDEGPSRSEPEQRQFEERHLELAAPAQGSQTEAQRRRLEAWRNFQRQFEERHLELAAPAQGPQTEAQRRRLDAWRNFQRQFEERYLEQPAPAQGLQTEAQRRRVEAWRTVQQQFEQRIAGQPSEPPASELGDSHEEIGRPLQHPFIPRSGDVIILKSCRHGIPWPGFEGRVEIYVNENEHQPGSEITCNFETGDVIVRFGTYSPRWRWTQDPQVRVYQYRGGMFFLVARQITWDLYPLEYKFVDPKEKLTHCMDFHFRPRRGDLIINRGIHFPFVWYIYWWDEGMPVRPSDLLVRASYDEDETLSYCDAELYLRNPNPDFPDNWIFLGKDDYCFNKT